MNLQYKEEHKEKKHTEILIIKNPVIKGAY